MELHLLGLAIRHIDALQVAALGPPEHRKNVREFVVRKSAPCTDSQAEAIAGAWNSLPFGMQARCHTPGYALRVIVDEKVVFSAAICWQCNNVSFAGEHASVSTRTFDAKSNEARELLKLCKQVVDDAD